MSAHPLPQRRGWLSALAAQVADYVFEEVEQDADPSPARLDPHPVLAIVSASPRSGATTVARMLAAELAARADGAALVTATAPIRRAAPPSRAAARLAVGMTGIAPAQPLGRICVACTSGTARQADPTAVAAHRSAAHRSAAHRSAAHPGVPAEIVNAARYLAPVVLDVPPDGSAAGIASIADRIAVVAGATDEPALLAAVATVLGGDPIKIVNRITDPEPWSRRADLALPDSRIAARAAALGTRPLGPLGAAISELADRMAA